MHSIKLDKDSLLAIFLLALIVAFLSSPYLVQADATVDGFFPRNFVTQVDFNQDVQTIVAKRSSQQKTQINSGNQKIQNDNCKQIIKTARDSFSIPAELVNCVNSSKSQ
jgi:hypothetical protein